jgi:hypothetical protein
MYYILSSTHNLLLFVALRADALYMISCQALFKFTRMINSLPSYSITSRDDDTAGLFPSLRAAINFIKPSTISSLTASDGKIMLRSPLPCIAYNGKVTKLTGHIY